MSPSLIRRRAEVGAIGLGCMGFTHGYDVDQRDDERSISVVRRALELGVTLIDTADVLIESFRPKTARAIGVSAEQTRAARPRLGGRPRIFAHVFAAVALQPQRVRDRRQRHDSEQYGHEKHD